MQKFRWAVNINDWIPNKNQWIKAMKCIQVEERERIRKFRYRKDAKSSIVGRLLLRLWASLAFKIPSNQFEFTRTDRGRPKLKMKLALDQGWDFNVSHAGNFTVLVAQTSVDSIGVDVMGLNDKRFERSDEKIQEFFRIMNKQFTQSEWDQIKTSQNQLAAFFRFWTLKESFIKAHGDGLAWDLQRLNFDVKSSDLFQPKKFRESVLSIDGNLAQNWIFEETIIDSEHCISTALKNSSDDSQVTPDFEVLHMEHVLDDLVEFNDPNGDNDEHEWTHFLNQIENKPF